MPRMDVSTVVKLRESVNPILALIDPSFEVLVRYSCMICGGSLFSKYIDKSFVEALRQVFLDLYALYNSYVPWLLVDEIKIGRGSCPIIRSLSCNNISYNLNNDELVVSVECDKIYYRCVFKLED